MLLYCLANNNQKQKTNSFNEIKISQKFNPDHIKVKMHFSHYNDQNCSLRFMFLYFTQDPCIHCWHFYLQTVAISGLQQVPVLLVYKTAQSCFTQIKLSHQTRSSKDNKEQYYHYLLTAGKSRFRLSTLFIKASVGSLSFIQETLYWKSSYNSK